MTCHKIGWWPMGNIGFGKPSEYSRIRMPRPPQKSTTFIPTPLRSPICPAAVHNVVFYRLFSRQGYILIFVARYIINHELNCQTDGMVKTYLGATSALATISRYPS